MLYRPETAAAVSYLVKSLVSQTAKRFEAVERTNHAQAVQAADESDGDRETASKDARSQRSQRDEKNRLLQRARMKPSLKVFDLCSGSGCIPLLFWHEYFKAAQDMHVSMPGLEILGFEMSKEALSLARENHEIVQMEQSEQGRASLEASQSLQHLKFIQANVLNLMNSTKELSGLPQLREAIVRHTKDNKSDEMISKDPLDNDIWISNPPYISPQSYTKNTEKSVRKFEPKAALVPPSTSSLNGHTRLRSGNDGDRFHQDILEQAVSMRVKVVLLEVEDMEQAIRVANMAAQQNEWYSHQIWKDEPGANVPDQYLSMDSKIVSVHGSGEGRSVLVCTRDGARLIGRWRTKWKGMQATDRTLFGMPVLEKNIESPEGVLKRSQGAVDVDIEKEQESKAAIRAKQKKKELKRKQVAQSTAGSNMNELDMPSNGSLKQASSEVGGNLVDSNSESFQKRQKRAARADPRATYTGRDLPSTTSSVHQKTKRNNRGSSARPKDAAASGTASPRLKEDGASKGALRGQVKASIARPTTKLQQLNEAKRRPNANGKRGAHIIETRETEEIYPKSKSAMERRPRQSTLPPPRQSPSAWSTKREEVDQSRHVMGAATKPRPTKTGARTNMPHAQRNRSGSRAGTRYG